ncbi:MAG: NCS2 family permease [Clostridia bacterium]|nr:NCS2 family permease [Clostridia bacterium]
MDKVEETVEVENTSQNENTEQKPAKKQNGFFRALGFDPVAKQTSFKTEFVAGLVTFLAMAYILTVNPNQIFGAGSKYWASAFIATALGAVIGTLLMAFLAKMPLAQASGMGLNSMLGGIIGGWGGYGAAFTPGQGFMLVLISGLVFVLLSVIKIKGHTFRELVFDGMPISVRSAISVGIGLFIAYIGFQNAGIIVTNGYTQVGFVDFTKWGEQTVNALVPGWAAAKTAVVALSGLFFIAILDKLKVKGSIILGILGAAIVGIPLGVTDLSILAGDGDISWKFWNNFGNYFSGDAETSVFGSFTNVFKTGLIPENVSVFTIIMIVITMCMIDMFDTMGTIVGCCSNNRVLSDENNKPHNYGKIMMSDAIATCTGAMLGTSTVTTFVESGAGVSAGGRTGLTALTTAAFFFLSMFALPLFAAIPSAAAASALIYVGVLMMKNNVKSIEMSDAIGATSAFLTIVVMVLGYSITKGIGVGMISYTLMSSLSYLVELIKYAITKKEKPVWKVSVVAIVVSLLFCVYFFVPATAF